MSNSELEPKIKGHRGPNWVLDWGVSGSEARLGQPTPLPDRCLPMNEWHGHE